MNRNPKPGRGRPPGARNKITHEIKELARQYGPKAFNVLTSLMDDKSISASARALAANSVLDRAYGKAPQPQTGEGGEGPIRLLVGWMTGGE